MKRSYKLPILTTATALLLGMSPIISHSLSLNDLRPEELPSWRNSARIEDLAFAYYDYRQSPGTIGLYSNLEVGAASLFDAKNSGIEGLTGDWSWVSGKGWLLNGVGSITYHWWNSFVETNKKNFHQVIVFKEGTPIMLHDFGTEPVASIEYKFPTTDWNPKTNTLTLDVTITPQPDEFFFTATFESHSPAILEQGWVLDQCTPIPEPSMLNLVLAGFAIVFAIRSSRAPHQRAQITIA